MVHEDRISGSFAVFTGWAFLAMGSISGLRAVAPDALPWHLIRSYRPPLETWQTWTLAACLLLFGARLLVLGKRMRARETRESVDR